MAPLNILEIDTFSPCFVLAVTMITYSSFYEFALGESCMCRRGIVASPKSMLMTITLLIL